LKQLAIVQQTGQLAVTICNFKNMKMAQLLYQAYHFFLQSIGEYLGFEDLRFMK